MNATRGGLTELDLLGPEWLIVATRADGDRFVVAQCVRRRSAERLCRRLAQHLEGVQRVVVERIGETEELPVRVRRACRQRRQRPAPRGPCRYCGRKSGHVPGCTRPRMVDL